MIQNLEGGLVYDARQIPAAEYLPNRGVFLSSVIGRARGDGFGLHFGRIEPGCAIAREVHPECSETVFVLSGDAVGLVNEAEVALGPGQVMHVEKGTPHGLRNVGSATLEFLVVGHPDF